jgi:N6-adenosine-specific RNA methylase IME4
LAHIKHRRYKAATYQIIYADPPWRYEQKKVQGAAENHYPTMSIDELCALPVAELAANDCVLFLWATFPQLPEALQLIKAWGFRYKTVAFVWLKRNRKSPSWFYGLGYWTRGNAEICLLATKGKPKRNSAGVHQFIISPIEQHSKKPDEARQKILALMGDLPAWSCLHGRKRWDGMCGAMKLQAICRLQKGETMAYVSVPKDLTKVKTKVLFNLTKRQLLCFGISAAIGLPLFFLLKDSAGTTVAAMVMIFAMLPGFMFGVYEKNGQPLEVIGRQMIETCFLRPKERPYQTNNAYAALVRQHQMEMEVKAIVQGSKARSGTARSGKNKADPRRKKAD